MATDTLTPNGAAGPSVEMGSVPKIEVPKPAPSIDVQLGNNLSSLADQGKNLEGIHTLKDFDPMLARAVNPHIEDKPSVDAVPLPDAVAQLAAEKNDLQFDVTNTELNKIQNESRSLRPDAVSISSTKSEIRDMSPKGEVTEKQQQELKSEQDALGLHDDVTTEKKPQGFDAQNIKDGSKSEGTTEEDPNGTTPFPDDDKTIKNPGGEISSTSGDDKKENVESTSVKSDTANKEVIPTEKDKTSDSNAEGEAKIKTLELKIADKTITPEEYAHYRELKGAEDLDKLVREGKATDEQLEQWKKGAEPEDVTTLTLEEEEAHRQQELEEIGMKFFSEFADDENTDKSNAEKIAVEFNQKLAEQQGFNLSQAKEAELRDLVKKIIKPETAGGPKETAKMKYIKDRLVELSKLEMRLRNTEELAKNLKDQIESAKASTDKAEVEYENEKDPNERNRKLLLFQREAMRLQGLNDTRENLKSPWLKDSIDRRQLLGQIHRKIGSKSLLGNLAYGAKTLGMEAVFSYVSVPKYALDRFA